MFDENKSLANKNMNVKSNITYLDYKHFSGRFSQKNINNKNNEISNNYIDKRIKKPKVSSFRKKNNSFVLNRDNNINNNKIITKAIYQTLDNNNNNNNNNTLIYKNNINNINIHKQNNLLNYNNTINSNGNNNNKIIPIVTKAPISIKVKKNIISKMPTKNPIKAKKKLGNKLSILNTLLNNDLILFQKIYHQKEAIEKLKTRPNNGVYFIYVDKVTEGYSFKGIYKRGPSEINHICNKIYGIPNTPLMLSYEKFYILVENEEKKFEFKKLRDINVLSFIKTILLIKNK
jgi:hypothetical protein